MFFCRTSNSGKFVVRTGAGRVYVVDKEQVAAKEILAGVYAESMWLQDYSGQLFLHLVTSEQELLTVRLQSERFVRTDGIAGLADAAPGEKAACVVLDGQAALACTDQGIYRYSGASFVERVPAPGLAAACRTAPGAYIYATDDLRVYRYAPSEGAPA